MANTKFDIKSFQTTVQTEAQRGLHASVGVADRAIEVVKEYVAEAQKRFEAYQKDAQKQLAKAQKSVKDFEFQPAALANQTATVFTARVEELSKDAKARRIAVEKRVAELQAEAQKFVTANVETATDTLQDLVERGETVVKRIRRVPTSTASNPANIKAPAAKSTATKSTATKSTATKSTATKSTAKKAPATKTATKTAAKKAPAKKTAKKTTAKKTTKSAS